MNRPDKSSKACCAGPAVFGLGACDARPSASRPGNLFEAADDATGADGRVEVTLSTRIQLRGYPGADAFMQRMAQAWGLTWGAVRRGARNGDAAGRLARAGCLKSRRSSTNATCCVRKAAAGRRCLTWKVHPRYYIDARGRGLAQGVEGVRRSGSRRPRLELLRDGPEKSVELHELTTSSSKADLDNARATLLKWLDSHYPRHRDPFAYWTDCDRPL
jgi:hypothetical protein